MHYQWIYVFLALTHPCDSRPTFAIHSWNQEAVNFWKLRSCLQGIVLKQLKSLLIYEFLNFHPRLRYTYMYFNVRLRYFVWNFKEDPHKMSYPYIERYDFHTILKFKELFKIYELIFAEPNKVHHLLVVRKLAFVFSCILVVEGCLQTLGCYQSPVK